VSTVASEAGLLAAATGEATEGTPTLRQYLNRIVGRPDDLRVVSREVRPADFDVTGVLEHLERIDQHPAVLFTHPQDLRGRPAEAALLANLFASRARCAEMLGLDPAQAGAELGAAYAARVGRTVTPVTVPSADAPVHAHVLQGDDATFDALPAVRHFEMDLGPVLTMAHAMRAPGEDFYNVTFAKTFPEDGGRRGGITIHTPDMSRMLREWARRGERVPIVNVLGHDPAFWLGSLALTPYGTNEYETIGGCMGRPVRLTPSVTWGAEVMVPADAEIVVEGEIVPGERTVVNPFGEISRQYQAQELAPVMEVKAVTFRERPIMQEVYSAHREHFLLGLIPREGSIFNMLRRELGNVTAVNLPYSGCGRFTCYISMKDPQEGQPKLAALKTLAAAPMFQTVVVVDSDIDVFKEEDVLWAINMYVDPHRDIDLLKGMREPTDFRAMRDNRLLVDATRPRHIAFPTRPQVPPHVLERINLDEWLANGPQEGNQ
jgi:2,5-furandicarboxylate decarboxylase 1